MPFAGRLLGRLRRLVHRDEVEHAMDAEMRHHIECETAERIASGMAPDAARRAALLDFGAVERFKEEVRDARGTRAAEDLWRDLAYAARVLRCNLPFTAAIALTFALAIGATTSILSVVYGVLLRPLPYADPGRLVALWERDVSRGSDRNVVSLANFLAWREQSPAFAGMSALMPRSSTLQTGDMPERVPGAEVSPGYFGLLGVAPALGRDLRDGDTNVVVLSDGFWRRRFGADSAVVGRSLSIDGAPFTIAGVMPAGFDPPRFGWLGEQELWFPFVPSEQAHSWGRFLLVVARVKPGVTITAARAELVGLARRLERESAANRGWSVSMVGLRDQIAGDARPQLVAALTAVALLLVLAVGNVATLTLALMRRRRHELAVRRAIGATDARLFRQLFAQSALLGLIGTAVGLITAVPALRILVLLLPAGVPRVSSVALDAPVLIVSTVVAAVATVLFGVVAATRGRPTGQLTGLDGSPRVSLRVGTGGLVACEVALVLALAVLALLTARSFAALRAVDVGFDPGGVVAARVALPGTYDTAERQRAIFDAMLERFRAVPGVLSTGVVSARPFGGLGPATTVYDPADPPRGPGGALVADARYADAGFFSTLRIAVVAGTACIGDTPESAPLRVVVNQALARAVWPGRSAIGRRLRVQLFGGREAEVCGIARDVHLIDSRTVPRPTFYLPFSRFPSQDGDVVVRTAGEPDALVPFLRAALASIDPSLPLYKVDTMSRTVETALASDRFATFLLSAFAIVAFLLAGVGVFGVFLGEVSARRREIGIRLALGGKSLGIVGLFLRRALAQAAIGVVAGGLIASLLARLIGSVLFGVSPADPFTYIVATVLVVAVTASATALPAWLALRRSPLSVLRES